MTDPNVSTVAASPVVLAPVMTIEELKRRHDEMKRFVVECLEPGVDYQVIKGKDKDGKEKDRYSLNKPGAEKLCEYYGLTPVLEVTHRVEDWDKTLFHYEVKVTLFNSEGQPVGEGIGSCNSREDRYADAWVFGSDVPAELDKNSLDRKEYTSKRGEPYFKYKVPNQNVPTLINTFLKIGGKRGYIDATIRATHSSGLLTQDIEDMGHAVGVDTAETAKESPPRPNAQRLTQARGTTQAPQPGRPTPPTPSNIVVSCQHVNEVTGEICPNEVQAGSWKDNKGNTIKISQDDLMTKSLETFDKYFCLDCFMTEWSAHLARQKAKKAQPA